MRPPTTGSRVMRPLAAALTALALAVGAAPASAQYFGQNKVRYETFDFEVLKTEHFDIHHYDEGAAIARDTGRMAERWYARLSRILGHQLTPNQPIVLYASHAAFRGTTVIPGAIGETTGGVTEGLRRRLVMPLAGPLAETDHVLGHELVHAFQFDLTSGSGLPGALQLPLWFVEGMAEYLSVGPVDALTAMWIRDALLRDDLPPIGKLDDPRYFPYRFGQAFWSFIGGRYGDERVAEIFREAARDGDTDGAFRRVLGVSTGALSEQWHDAIRVAYEPVLSATASPESHGRPLISAESRGGELNVGPVLSPDGSQVVFFSERDLFSIDLFLADAQTGEIKRKITETAVDPHFDSLQFVNSAGAWSGDGRLFAFGAVSNGRPELTFYDMSRNRIERSVKLPQLGEILSLTWSPDNRSVALSAVAGGQTDLFIYEPESGDLRRLTNDVFADLQPAWSPDGARIAFVTDRFGSDPAELSYGDYRLAFLNPATGAIAPLSAFDQGKHINPQWSADGQSVYFVSDRDGIANIYRVSVASGDLFQITNVQTGITGISNLSPAFAVASKANGLVFTAFEGGNYSIYSMEMPAALAGRPPVQNIAPLSAALLPPRETPGGGVVSLLRDAGIGLPQAGSFMTSAYKPKLSLDYIAPPSVSVGVSNFGALVGGGTAFYWSDLLGYHNLTTTVQTEISSEGGSFLNNLSAIVGYAHQKSRWTWGITAGQVPYVTGQFSRALGRINGTPVIVDRDVQFWEINREVSGIFAYPFSRAQRLEFVTGYRNIGFDARVRTQAFLPTGELIADDSEDIDAPASLHMGTASAALVYDTSISGGTGPVAGQRYRFEIGGSGGSLNYSTLLGDYRRYFPIVRPLLLAGRILHFGRYGGDSEDTRLQELSVGYSSLVRGYTAGSFAPSDCGPALEETGECPAFDQLLGSRIAVANAELRLPLLGALGVISTPSVPPVEAALFFDAGSAWTRANKANFLGGSRRPVTSYGASMRVNIFGFAIGQLSYVHPNDRPAKSWLWEFSLTQGF